jgi:hypothetical protein
MTDIKTLRQHIIDYMRDETKKRERTDVPTWWMRHAMPFTTTEIRAELKRMEANGLVTANRRQSNNHIWTLTDQGKAAAKE